jgi:flagellar basal body-associated protein FliL
MSRPARTTKTILIAAIAVLLLAGGGLAWQASNEPAPAPAKTETKKAPTTRLSYQGQEGKTALELLKQKAKVETKSSSLGEFVVSINGNGGGGKKYWLFYINDQEAQVGAGAYVTKNTDTIEWRLQ